MRLIAQLSEDFLRVQSIIQHDPEIMPPLADLYDAPTVALMLDVTDYEPQPGDNWHVSNVVKNESGRVISATFAPPPGPSVEELVNRLQDFLHNYIYAHYDLPTQTSLISTVTAPLAILLNPASTEAEKAGAQGQLAQIVPAVMPAWSWVQSVLVYYYHLLEQIDAGAAWESLDLNFAQRFDAADPKVLLQTFAQGA